MCKFYESLNITEYVQVRVGNAFSMNCTDPGIKSTSFNWSKANACDIKYDAVKGICDFQLTKKVILTDN